MPSPDDFSGEAVVNDPRIDAQVSEFNHRKQQQEGAAKFAVWLSTGLCGVAAVIAIAAMCFYMREGKIQWQIGALVAAFMVPATIVAATLVRAVYRQAESDDSGGMLERLNPYIAMLKEIRGVFDQGPKP